MRTFRRSATFDEVVERLAETPHPISKRSLFPYYRDLLCFAAVLGFDTNARHDLAENTVDFVDGRIFSNDDKALDLLYLIGLADSRDINLLREDNEDRLVTIFEQFAEGGLRTLKGWLAERPEDVDGDKAILAALHKYGYLKESQPSPADVTF
jgi:dnd system-associated protein 4